MMKLTAKEFYNKVRKNGVTYETCCPCITLEKWEELMEGAVRANKEIVKELLNIKCNLRNPYHSYRTDTHIVYIHSAIEYFYRVND